MGDNYRIKKENQKKRLMRELINKIDAKTGIIILLFCMSGIFFTMYMLSGDNHRKEIKQLQKKNKELQKEKEKLQSEFVILIDSISADSIKIVKLNQELLEINKKLLKKEEDLKRSEGELKNMKDSYTKTKKEIEKLKSQPIKRTGSELLQSIKEKTK